MEAGNHKNHSACFSEENAIGKDPQPGTTNILQNARKSLRMGGDALKLMFKLIDEAVAQPELSRSDQSRASTISTSAASKSLISRIRKRGWPVWL